jgi:predicted DsbA family dithiol-disulfide isomerase
VRVDVYSDVVCPWCYVGEKRLERALLERPGLEWSSAGGLSS